MRTIYKYSRYFGRNLGRQQETLVVFLVALITVVLYCLWGATLLH